MPCKLDKVFLSWLHDRGYETRYDGEGQIHIYRRYPRHPGEFPSWEIDIYYFGGTLVAIGLGAERFLQLADPELFYKLGELFPIHSSGVFIGGRLRRIHVRLTRISLAVRRLLCDRIEWLLGCLLPR